MARARFFDVATDPAGRPIPSATLNVYQPGTTTPIAETIYAADSGGTTLANPLTANAQGEIEFFLAVPKRVDLRWSKNGFVAETHSADVAWVDWVPSAEKAAPNGVATLDAGGLVPLAQIPGGAALDAEVAAAVAAEAALRTTADSTLGSAIAAEAVTRGAADTAETAARTAAIAALSGTYERRFHFNVLDYGAVGDGVTNDTIAIQAAITAATPSQGIVWFPPAVYAYGGLTLPKGVSLCGTHVPSADPTTFSTGSTLLRIVNSVGITIHGANPTTNRIGANRISGIRFKETLNVSALATLDCRAADSMVLQDVSFWQEAGGTTVGHAVAAEDCWDWRVQNVITKHCGRAASSKYPFYLYNGTIYGCNDWDFIHLRCQETDGTSIYFDSTNTGFRNTLFDLVECKFEDARSEGSRAATVHVDGNASNVTFYQTQFGGALTHHCNVPAAAIQWTWDGCVFANLASGADSSLAIAGSSCKVIAAHFNTMTITQLMKITGGNNVVIGCTQGGSAAPFNTVDLPITTLILCPQLSRSSIGGQPSADTALVVGLPTAGATALYGILARPYFGADGTNTVQAVATQPRTADAAYTVNNVHGVRCLDAAKGTGSTITTQVGLEVDNQTQGANNFAIRTNAGPVSLGDTLELRAAAAARASGRVGLGNSVQSTVGATGAAAALPAQPLGYLIAYIGGTKIAIPYYTG